MDDENVEKEILAYIEGKRKLEEIVNFLINPIYETLELSKEDLNRNDKDQEKETYSIYNVWSIISSIAIKIPYSVHQPLLRLCEEIRQRKVPLDESLKELYHHPSYWDITGEEQIAFLGIDFREDLDILKRGSKEFHNLVGFTSQMTMYKTKNCKPLGDYTLHGLWIIRESLEDPKTIKDLIETQTVEILEDVRIWLYFAGKRIYKGVLKGETFDGRSGILGSGVIGQLDENTRGLTLPRWQLWRDRLRKVCENTLASEQQKEKSKEILEAMNQSEIECR